MRVLSAGISSWEGQWSVMADKILVTRSSMPPLEEYIDEIRSMWDTHWLTNMGEKHKEFQRNLIEYMNVPNVELLTNGHMAIELTLQALQLEGEVITTPFTFASTTHAIVRNGLEPVFCDINQDNYTIDVNQIESLITEKTCAIMPVHVYGNICDVEAIDKIAKKYNLKVMYDAAHTFGETYKGIGVGNFGDVSCFSFHATKVFNSIEGGAVTYKDESLGNKLYELKNFGIHGAEIVSEVGANAKMNEFCAAMGICNLRHIDEEIEKRKKIFNRYREHLGDIKGLRIHSIQKDLVPNYSYFPVVFQKDLFGKCRDEIYQKLKSEDIIPRKYFYPLVTKFSCYQDKYGEYQTPVARYVSENVLTLPMYADLEFEDIDRICKIIMTK